jgi:hypothetical protein
MVDFNFTSKTETPGNRHEEREREGRRPSEAFLTKRERIMAKLRENSRAGKRLRVEPKNDLMRQILRHPTAGFFRGQGAAEWPDDTFTHRRLRDGDIKLAADQRR